VFWCGAGKELATDLDQMSISLFNRELPLNTGVDDADKKYTGLP
jgi:hypothetical protein